MTKTEAARDKVQYYLELNAQNGHNYPKRFIATVLYNEHPEIYKDVEDARQWVRYVTNCLGTNNRIKNNDISRQFALMPDMVRETETDEPFIIPKSVKRTLWIADIHGLFYNREAFEIAINQGVKQKCDSVVILGDFMDFYDKSKFDKNPLIAEKFFQERDWGIDVLELLQSCFGQVILKMGNHDQRREHYIYKKSVDTPEFMNLSSYPDFLFFDGCKVNFIEAHRHLIYGKLNGIHGHEYQGGGIHIAYTRFNKALDNVISAHSHKSQSIIRSDINRQILGSWTIGCLCHLSPQYCPKNDWNNGFAISEKDESGDFELSNYAIYNGKIFSV